VFEFAFAISQSSHPQKFGRIFPFSITSLTLNVKYSIPDHELYNYVWEHSFSNITESNKKSGRHAASSPTKIEDLIWFIRYYS
jgi:hypothetical protein